MCGALASRYSAGRELFADQFLMAREIMSGTPLERFWSARTVGALVQVGVTLDESSERNSGAPRRFPGRVQVAPPNGHRPDLTLQR